MEPDVAFVVAPDEQGERLDKLLLARVPELGRRAAARLFASGAVRVDGRRAEKGWLALAGQRVSVTASMDLLPNADVPLDVRLQTADLIVVCKPAGLPTAPIDRSETHTLANALLARYPEMRGVGYRPVEPGLLHRLDTHTSGLVLAARHARAFDELRTAITTGALHKKYLAVVSGRGLDERLTIDLPLEPDPSDRRRVRIGGGTFRRTEARLLESTGDRALVELSVARAYRHQIRAHLAAVGHPIVGDALYGGVHADELRGRHALHASHIGWAGSSTIVAFAIDDALPHDLSRLMLRDP